MTIRKQFFSLLLPAALVCATTAAAVAASPSWLPVPGKACLPTGDRMSTDRTQACHCPPQEMCKDASSMPGYVFSHCCPGYTGCDAEIVYESFTRCPHRFTTGPETLNYCLAYDPVAVDGSTLSVRDIKNDDYDPEDLSPEDEEFVTRVQASLALNSCLKTQCVPFLEEIDELVESNSSANARRGSPASVLTETPGVAPLRAFADCELSCRQEAATALGGAAEDASRALVSALSLNRDEIPRYMGVSLIGYRDDTQHYNVFTDRHLAFLNDVFVTWRENRDRRQERVESFLAGNPADSFPTEHFPGKLECARTDSNTLCYSAKLNNNSCSSCLAPDTPVTMADGSERPIDTLAAGEKVKSAYGKEAEIEEVVVLDWPVLTLWSINDGELELTADHPVMTTKGWRAVDYNGEHERSMQKYGLRDVPVLREGDTLVTQDGHVVITSLKALETKTNAQTYNLKLKDAESFYANGILVKDN
jgi:hypothetical protein